jgi:hypothetical protein
MARQLMENGELCSSTVLLTLIVPTLISSLLGELTDLGRKVEIHSTGIIPHLPSALL